MRSGPGYFRQPFYLLVNVIQYCLYAEANFFQHRRNNALFIFEHCREQMYRQHLRVTVLGSQFTRTLHCFLRLDCEFVPADCHLELLN